jgi:catechol 2,3-dioxygenase-like lactoylglutathione lyase family enzyme
MRLSVTVDVPDLAAGIAFYRLFGLEEVARPVPQYAVLKAGEVTLGLMEKAAGTVPAPGAAPRDYARHWTPVHLDIDVADWAGTLAAVEAAGGSIEARHIVPGRRAVAFCADPFGHGFCVLGAPPAGAA